MTDQQREIVRSALANLTEGCYAESLREMSTGLTKLGATIVNLAADSIDRAVHDLEQFRSQETDSAPAPLPEAKGYRHPLDIEESPLQTINAGDLVMRVQIPENPEDFPWREILTQQAAYLFKRGWPNTADLLMKAGNQIERMRTKEMLSVGQLPEVKEPHPLSAIELDNIEKFASVQSSMPAKTVIGLVVEVRSLRNINRQIEHDLGLISTYASRATKTLSDL